MALYKKKHLTSDPACEIMSFQLAQTNRNTNEQRRRNVKTKGAINAPKETKTTAPNKNTNSQHTKKPAVQKNQQATQKVFKTACNGLDYQRAKKPQKSGGLFRFLDGRPDENQLLS